MLADARRAAAFAGGISAYLRADLSDEAIARRLRDDLATRDTRLLDLLRRAVYDRPTSPYLALLRHAGAELGDVERLVAEEGVEGALERLRDRGVHVRPEELKGRTAIVRGSLRLEVADGDFDNPLRREGIPALSGGSSGAPLRVGLGLDDLAEDIAYVRPWVQGAGLTGCPLVVWRSAPPFRSGLRNAVRSLRSGLVLAGWWSPAPVGRRAGVRDALAVEIARAVARAHGASLPRPGHAPLDAPWPVLGKLAELAADGRRPVLDATAGAAVRVALAARRRGVSLAGVTVRAGGEPLSPGKAEALRSVGMRPACHYQSHEIGRIGVACGDPEVVDDVHLASGRIAVVSGGSEANGERLLLTCISPSSQRIILNADIGDTAVLRRRGCACPLGAAGLELHAHTIRPATKLTADGTNILYAELLELMERQLPARFGGGPSDYQLVETEEDGLPRVHVVVSPRVGAVREADVVAVVLAAVADGASWRRLTAGVWGDGSTVRVVRREPYATPSGKLHAFHRSVP